MPISLDEFRFPKFIKIKESYPFGENPKDKFLNTANYPRRYRGESGFPQPGYNPNSGVSNPRDIDINSDDLTLPPY
jgi:hypothetical protein